MDSLLTAFLSSGNGMMDNNFVRVDQGRDCGNNNSDLKGEWKLTDYLVQINEENFGMAKYCKRMSKKSIGVSMKSHALSFEIDVSPVVSTISTQNLKTCDGTSFAAYLNHQMYHKLAQKRITSFYFVQPSCCLTLGSLNTVDHSKMKSHYCCETEMTLLNSKKTDCSCAMSGPPTETFCEKHKLFVTDTVNNDNFCSWTILFSDSNCKNKNDNCIVNPLYDMDVTDVNMNISSESFEVEFVDGDFNVDVQCGVNNTCLQNLTFFYDVSDDEDSESLVYETSDDEEDDDLYFDTDVIQFNLSSTPFALNSLRKRKTPSKYHVNCCVKNDTKNNCESVSHITGNNTDERHVHFAGKTVHHIIAWSYAYNLSRKSDWVKAANDRGHFQRRVQHLSKILNPLLVKKFQQFTQQKELEPM